MRLTGPFLVVAALAAGCASNAGGENAAMDHHEASAASSSGAWTGVTEAVAQIHALAKGAKIRGMVVFTQTAEGVRVVAEIEGLKPNAKHAFHIHEFGDVSSADGKSAGGHYNPQGHHHGGPDSAMHHAGDLGNLQTDAKGRAHYDRVITGISVAGDVNPIVGRSVIIHEKEDDLATDPAGAAGDRIAGGVIGVGKAGETHMMLEPVGKKAK